MRDRLIELLKKPTPIMLGETAIGERSMPLSTACNLADHLLANGVTVQEWISVKDRLPEDGDVVLVCNVDMMLPTLCQWDAREDGWLGGKWTFGRSAFTHWMPLPQPPKGE